MGGASLDAGRLPLAPAQARFLGGPAGYTAPTLASPSSSPSGDGGWGNPALELDYQGLSGKGTVEKDLKKIWDPPPGPGSQRDSGCPQLLDPALLVMKCVAE